MSDIHDEIKDHLSGMARLQAQRLDAACADAIRQVGLTQADIEALPQEQRGMFADVDMGGLIFKYLLVGQPYRPFLLLPDSIPPRAEPVAEADLPELLVLLLHKREPTPCPLCAADPHPANSSPRKCAFTSGVFDASNWRCGTVEEIRYRITGDPDLPNLLHARHADSSYAAAFVRYGEVNEHGDRPAGLLTLNWYKERGRTDRMEWAYHYDDDRVRKPITLDEALHVLEALKNPR